MQKLFRPEDLQESAARHKRRTERLEERLDRAKEELLARRDHDPESLGLPP